MTAPDSPAADDELQFDRATADAPGDQPAAAAGAVPCAGCKTPIRTEYYHINGKSVCARCRDAVAARFATPRGWGSMGRATLFGVGAAIAGAVVYYAVIAITDLEIGIVAILIGYMVGWAIRKGTGGRGGRQFQVLAAVLTYWAVGLAYTPLALKDLRANDARPGAVAAADSTQPSTAAAAPTSSGDSGSVLASGPTSRTTAHSSLLAALGVMFVFVFALPVMAIAGSLPAGLLSAFIILIGIRQAWRMTAAPTLKVTGPYRVGAQHSAAAG